MSVKSRFICTKTTLITTFWNNCFSGTGQISIDETALFFTQQVLTEWVVHMWTRYSCFTHSFGLTYCQNATCVLNGFNSVSIEFRNGKTSNTASPESSSSQPPAVYSLAQGLLEPWWPEPCSCSGWAFWWGSSYTGGKSRFPCTPPCPNTFRCTPRRSCVHMVELLAQINSPHTRDI